MRIETSQNKTYTVSWIDTSITDQSKLLAQMVDERRLSEIAAEFDGLTEIRRFDENQGDKVYDGYTLLAGIQRMGSEVLIKMERTATA